MRAWAEINLDAIVHNYNEIRKITDKNAKILAVIKADGYGHGFKEIANVLSKAEVDAFGVATTDEAIQIRNAGFEQEVLILGTVLSDDLSDMIAHDISVPVSNFETAKAISDMAKILQKQANIHIKLDTGMGRIGFVCGDDDQKVADEIAKISSLPCINIAGIFSHFSKADEHERDYTDLQYKRFSNVCNLVEGMGVKLPCKHICNSAGIMEYPMYHMDMVRAGIITYGLYPSDEVDKTRLDLIPAMTVKAKITNIKNIEHDSKISYGGKYTATQGKKIATVSIGYADGFSRVLSGKAKVIVNGHIVSVVGNICMDQCMIDATEIDNIKIGDEVIIFGSDGNNTITVESVASMMGTINYEVVCLVGKRIPRTYIRNNKTVSILNYLV